MNWQRIRELHPHSWVLIEALDGRTEGGERIITQMSIHGVHGDDWESAWEQYKALHHEDKWREYYPIHTDREEMDIGVIDAFGRRVIDGDED
jgi:hypothetical protein